MNAYYVFKFIIIIIIYFLLKKKQEKEKLPIFKFKQEILSIISKTNIMIIAG